MFPTSVTHFKLTLIAMLAFLAGISFVLQYPQFSVLTDVLLLMLCWLVPMIILEAIYLPHVRQALTTRTSQLKLMPAVWRWLGLCMTLVPIALGYWLFPEYKDVFYQHYWVFLQWTLPIFLVAAFSYFLWMGDTIKLENDPYWQLGLLLRGQTQQLQKAGLVQHALSWLVKAFFLPLMITFFWVAVTNLKQFNIYDVVDSLRYCAIHLLHPASIDYKTHFLSNNFTYVYNFLWQLLFLIDVAVACIGYLLSVRLLDNQVRSTEPTLLGWTVALVCYAPFIDIISTYYFAYDHANFTWSNWLHAYDITYVIWGSIILLLVAIYVSATIVFGLRFSNLTHRGIITGGPYRYVKHPAYLSKNLSWWLVSIPFISATGQYSDALRCVLLLLGVNVIYYLRAKTEERHLSQDPVYRQYLQAISQQGLFAKCKNIFKNIWFPSPPGEGLGVRELELRPDISHHSRSLTRPLRRPPSPKGEGSKDYI
jgi:hypothetical protein